MILNAIFAVPSALAQTIKTNFNTLPDWEQSFWRDAKENRYKGVDIAATNHAVTDVIAEKSILQDINNKYAAIVPLGVWYADGPNNGLQFGQSYDAEGSVTGTPTFGIHPKLADSIPDYTTYDVDGSAIATGPHPGGINAHKYFGMKDRTQ